MAPGAEDPFGEEYGDDDESPLSDEDLNQII
jgi:hypothetical protein